MTLLTSLHTDTPSTLDNILTLGLVAALILVVIIAVIRKALANKKAATQVTPPVIQTEAPTAPGAAGQVKLYNTQPKTAALLMAIVADKLGKPINELRFISIKEVK